MDTVEAGGLSVAKALYDFMNDEALPETGLAVERFWDGLGAIIRGFAPRNRKLLDLRDTLQARIDDFHRARRPPHPSGSFSPALAGLFFCVQERARMSRGLSSMDPRPLRLSHPSPSSPRLCRAECSGCQARRPSYSAAK